MTFFVTTTCSFLTLQPQANWHQHCSVHRRGLGGVMKSIYSVLFLAIGLLLLGCGSDPAQPAGNAPPTANGASKWSTTELSSNRAACAKSGTANFGGTADQWTNYCVCIYGIASQRWTFADFRTNFDADWAQLKADNSHSSCVKSSGLPEFSN